MRTTLFIAIPFIVLASACYVAWHLWKTAPQGWKLLPSGLFVLWMATMVASFIFIERVPVKAATVLYEVGNTWMIAFLYLLLIFLLSFLINVLRGSCDILHIFPDRSNVFHHGIFHAQDGRGRMCVSALCVTAGKDSDSVTSH